MPCDFAVMMVVLWLSGLVRSHTMGGMIHVLPVIAIVTMVFKHSRRQDRLASTNQIGEFNLTRDNDGVSHLRRYAQRANEKAL